MPELSCTGSDRDGGSPQRSSQDTLAGAGRVLGNLALAYLRQRQLDAATATLHEAIDLLEASRGGAGLTVVSRDADDTTAAVEETARTADAVGEVDEEPSARDGDTPPGGPILPVPESPDELTSPESLIADDGSAGGPGVSLTVARDRDRDRVPTSRRRWINRITIDLAGQTIRYEWSDGTPGGASSISSGRGRPCTANGPCANQNNRNCTPTWTFHPAFLGGPGYTNSEGDAMAWYVDLGTGRGIGIHDSQPVLGRPASHGCVRVPMSIARTINQNVIRRTEVVISGKAATAPWRNRTCPAPPHHR